MKRVWCARGEASTDGSATGEEMFELASRRTTDHSDIVMLTLPSLLVDGIGALEVVEDGEDSGHSG